MVFENYINLYFFLNVIKYFCIVNLNICKIFKKFWIFHLFSSLFKSKLFIKLISLI